MLGRPRIDCRCSLNVGGVRLICSVTSERNADLVGDGAQLRECSTSGAVFPAAERDLRGAGRSFAP
jgi:hypothetical protein